MTEQKKEPTERKPTKEERDEADRLILRLQESGEYSRYGVVTSIGSITRLRFLTRNPPLSNSVQTARTAADPNIV